MQAEVARHPYFGPVILQAWKLVFNPPDGRPDVAHFARFIHVPTPDDYERLVPRLAALTAAEHVGPESFAAALTLRRACFSLSPEDSGAAALTLDYHLLPSRLDNELFAVKFAADGTLMEIVAES